MLLTAFAVVTAPRVSAAVVMLALGVVHAGAVRAVAGDRLAGKRA